MKRILTILLVLVMAFSFVACNNDFSSSDVTATPTTTNEPTPLVTPNIKENIVGTWVGVCRIEDEYCKGILWCEYFTINEDGTFTHDSMQYYHSNYVPLDGEVGWYVKPVGWPTLSGTYTLNEMNLVLSGCNSYYQEEEITYNLIQVEENKLIINNQFGTYYSKKLLKGMDLLELCEYFGVDASADSK